MQQPIRPQNPQNATGWIPCGVSLHTPYLNCCVGDFPHYFPMECQEQIEKAELMLAPGFLMKVVFLVQKNFLFTLKE